MSQPTLENGKDSLQTQHGGDHYKKLAIQVVEYCHANNLPFLEGCIIKYATRHRDKGKEEDLKKCLHFVRILLRLEYGLDSKIEYFSVKKEEHDKPAS